MKQLILIVITIALAISLPFFAWKIGRKINYSFSYRDMVREEIRAMVKPEALK